MLTCRQKEADINLQIEEVKKYLSGYQVAAQNIKAMSVLPENDYVRTQIARSRALQSDIERTLSKLKMSQKRTILEAHYIGGLSLRAIERKLLLSKSTVQKYHRAGLEKVGEILEKR